MADSNYSNSSEDKGLAQDDPFAELTRIMGHDPRPVHRPEAEKEDNAHDLALELENELMGDLMGEDDAAKGASEEDGAQDVAAAEDGAYRQSPAEPQEAPEARPEETFDPSRLSSIFEEVFASRGETEPSQEDESQDPADMGPGEESDDVGEHGFAAHDPDFDAPQETAVSDDEWAFSQDQSDTAQDAGTPDEEADQPMRFVSFRNAAPLLPALAAARQPEAPQEEGPVEDDFAPEWDEMDSQPPADEDETQVTQAGAPEDWRGEEMARDGEMEFSPPEVDTVDVPGEKVAATENLDIPDVRYGEETAKTELDEIEELLAGAFSAPGQEPEPPQTPAAEYETQESSATTGRAWTFDDEASDVTDGRDTTQARSDDDFIFDSLNDLRDQLSNRSVAGGAAASAMAPAPGAQPPRKSARRSGSRALYGSVAVLCLLLVGGAAMYFGLGGDADSGAVVVQADDEPVKIKPEDPGGTTIPNQDNQVYKRVSGEDAQPEPSQTQLVSTTEEPVELPGVQDLQGVQGSEAGNASAETSQQAQTGLSQPGETSAPAETSAKIDDRLQNTITEEPAEEDVAALEPRRVRSLVVRPDGSMVPREMPEPETANPVAEASASDGQNGTAAEGANQQASAAPAGTGTQPATEAAQTGTAAASETETAAAQQAESVPVPASRPANPQPATQAQEPAAEPQTQAPETQVAAASPQPAQPAASAPTSEWSVQIASQPSVEGAQQSYQQLAQRYGDLLQGKGVNIIKADISGKGTYYRVRIPSSSKDEAIRLCEQLKSAGGNCFVSK